MGEIRRRLPRSSGMAVVTILCRWKMSRIGGFAFNSAIGCRRRWCSKLSIMATFATPGNRRSARIQMIKRCPDKGAGHMTGAAISHCRYMGDSGFTRGIGTMTLLAVSGQASMSPRDKRCDCKTCGIGMAVIAITRNLGGRDVTHLFARCSSAIVAHSASSCGYAGMVKSNPREGGEIVYNVAGTAISSRRYMIRCFTCRDPGGTVMAG